MNRKNETNDETDICKVKKNIHSPEQVAELDIHTHDVLFTRKEEYTQKIPENSKVIETKWMFRTKQEELKKARLIDNNYQELIMCMHLQKCR